MKRIRNVSVETVLVFLSIGIALIGFTITIIGAFLNGLAMFNGKTDLSKGFGMILIGNSVALSGAIMIIIVFIVSIFKHYCVDIENIDKNE